jgi:hypothetical protein
MLATWLRLAPISESATHCSYRDVAELSALLPPPENFYLYISGALELGQSISIEDQMSGLFAMEQSKVFL